MAFLCIVASNNPFVDWNLVKDSVIMHIKITDIVALYEHLDYTDPKCKKINYILRINDSCLNSMFYLQYGTYLKLRKEIEKVCGVIEFGEDYSDDEAWDDDDTD